MSWNRIQNEYILLHTPVEEIIGPHPREYAAMFAPKNGNIGDIANKNENAMSPK